MQSSLPPGISIAKADSLDEWHMDIQVLDSNPLYVDQTYRLKFTFGKNYPIGALCGHLPTSPSLPLRLGMLTSRLPLLTTEAPEVQFIQLQSSATCLTPRPIPMHPHVYSNGIICLDLLGSAGWSPVQTVESVCVSIQSMLTGNTKNERPPWDSEFVMRNRQRPRDISFVYEDNSV